MIFVKKVQHNPDVTLETDILKKKLVFYSF